MIFQSDYLKIKWIIEEKQKKNLWMFSEAAEIIPLYFISEKKKEEGEEGDPVMIFVVSLPTPNVTVLRTFLVGKSCTVFMPCHPIASLTAARPDVLGIREPSCAFKHQLLRLNLPLRGFLGSKIPSFYSSLPEMSFHQKRELQAPNSHYQD